MLQAAATKAGLTPAELIAQFSADNYSDSELMQRERVEAYANMVKREKERPPSQ